ncbi:hypothetical protein BDV11DRAFT_170839 [Aspergillus similis]
MGVFVSNADMCHSTTILLNKADLEDRHGHLKTHPEQTIDEYRKQMSVKGTDPTQPRPEPPDTNTIEPLIVDDALSCAKVRRMSRHIVNVPVDEPVSNGSKAFMTHFGSGASSDITGNSVIIDWAYVLS